MIKLGFNKKLLLLNGLKIDIAIKLIESPSFVVSGKKSVVILYKKRCFALLKPNLYLAPEKATIKRDSPPLYKSINKSNFSFLTFEIPLNLSIFF